MDNDGDPIDVLVVDDEPDFGTTVVNMLEHVREDMQAVAESDPEQALARIQNGEAFDCIISDYEMPEMNGLELLRNVRETDEEIPFVLFTARGSEDVASEAISAGVTDYLQKEFGIEQYEVLAQRIKTAVGHERATAAFAESERMRATLIDNLPGIAYRASSGEDRPMELVSDGCVELTGYDPEQIESGDVNWQRDVVHPADRERVATTIQAALDADEQYELTYRIEMSDDTVRWTWEQGQGVGVGETQTLEGFVTDITDRKRVEEALETLHGSTRELMRATTADEIVEQAAETATAIIDVPNVVIYQFDETSRRLDPVASSVSRTETVEPPTISSEESAAWEVFVTEDPAAVEDHHSDPLSDCVGSNAIYVPLGNHGVFVAGSPIADGIGDQDRKLTRILAANVEAALDRAEQERVLRDREEELAEQNEALSTLEELNGVIRSVNRAIIDATTHEEIQEAVCEHLADADLYQFAWLGEYNDRAETIDISSWAGVGAEYVDEIASDPDGVAPERELAIEAARSQSVQVVDDVLESAAWDDRRRAALTYGFQSVAAVPLTDEHRAHGAAVLYASDAAAFSDRDTAVLEDLGEIIGHAVREAGRMQSLLTGSRVELELSVPSQEFVFNRLADTLDCGIELEGYIDRSDGSILSFLTAETEPDDAALQDVSNWAIVERINRLSQNDEDEEDDEEASGDVLYEIVMTVPRFFELLHDADGNLSSVRTHDDESTVVVSFPHAVDVRRIVDRLIDASPDTELAARRETTQASQTPRTLRATLHEALTDRQFEALQSAYHAGFFEWPRESTGESLAEALDVSPPTYHYHLRAAERKLLTNVLGD